jgi:hypothetical protein
VRPYDPSLGSIVANEARKQLRDRSGLQHRVSKRAAARKGRWR